MSRSAAPAVAVAAAPGIDVPAIRQAGPDLLSLALMDARNQTLFLLSRFEAAAPSGRPAGDGDLPRMPDWLAGHAAWFSEYWIARNPRRAQGRACPADAARLASVEPSADGWYHPQSVAAAAPHGRGGLQGQALRGYLLATLETTLELLERAQVDDDALYFFRVAQHHEDLLGEALLRLAQAEGVSLDLRLPAPAGARPPLGIPACRWVLGSAPGGFVPDVEQWAHEVAVPEFEIDAQPVSWSQFVEFVDDGGYDRAGLWHPQGWQWLQSLAQGEGRRGPAHVQQIGVASGAVMQDLFGRTTRMAPTQPAMHVTWWEADAWARWAGRRLATEVEWEVAAHVASARGFRWGEVVEWTAGTLRPFPGFTPDAWTAGTPFEAEPLFGQARVQRGASFATRARLKHIRARTFALPQDDHAFVGFRTCAV